MLWIKPFKILHDFSNKLVFSVLQYRVLLHILSVRELKLGFHVEKPLKSNFISMTLNHSEDCCIAA